MKPEAYLHKLGFVRRETSTGGEITRAQLQQLQRMIYKRPMREDEVNPTTVMAVGSRGGLDTV